MNDVFKILDSFKFTLTGLIIGGLIFGNWYILAGLAILGLYLDSKG